MASIQPRIKLLQPVSRQMAQFKRWLDARPEVKYWLKVMRLGLFQFGVGLSLAPITGTLNRVLIEDIGIAAAIVAMLISLHYFVSPIRAVIGYRSDKLRSQGTWRTPYVILGAMLTYGGLACSPFALILLGGNGRLPFVPALIATTLIFAMYGAGINIVETVYLALVSDITQPEKKGKVLLVLWFMLILGTVVSAIIISAFLVDYSHVRLIRVMQGSAVVFIVFTAIAMYRQEPLNADGSIKNANKVVRVRMSLWESLRAVGKHPILQGLFVLIFIATMAFATHDVLLEPYGGQVLGMSVSATMRLTALWGISTIVGVSAAAFLVWRKRSPVVLIGVGCLIGLIGFGVISAASNGQAVNLFRVGVACISLGRGLFLVGSVLLVVSLVDVSHAGLFLGVWGIVQGLAQGFGTIGGGIVRDVMLARTGSVVQGYTTVYIASLLLLAVAVALLLLGLGKRLRVSEIDMPWEGLEEIPADQLAF